MEASAIIKSFCEKVGIGYEPDADGTCSFEADGLWITIHDLRERNLIALVGDLGEPPPERLEQLYKTMLEANHLFGGTGGATLSFDANTGRFALCRVMPCVAVDADSFYSEAERFVSTLETWSKIISDFRESGSQTQDAESGKQDDFPSSGFIQV